VIAAAAIYARRSPNESERADDAKSVTRQTERARAYAAAQGWAVNDVHVYEDDGRSGADFDRPALLRLMNALRPRAPFEKLVVSESSRLGREQLEIGWS
jgi:DNA invertase Pin-like site-specific DNA recombinase